MMRVFSTRKRTTEVRLEVGKTATCKSVVGGGIRRSKSVLEDDAMREVFLCLQRVDIEACQLVNRRLRHIADASPFAMPLREILAAVEVSLSFSRLPCQTGGKGKNPLVGRTSKIARVYQGPCFRWLLADR